MDGDAAGIVNSDALRGYISRIVSLHEDRDALNEDIREVYKDAKDGGFDVTTLREIVREQRMEPEARHSRYALLDTYRSALGLLASTPLGEAAMARAEQQHPVHERPRPFAEQPIKRGRGRPRKQASDQAGDAIERAQTHLGGRPRKPRPMDFLPDADEQPSATC